MLQDQKLMAAVSRILQRSERQEDIRKLVGTYVDVGLLPQLNNTNHQIFYGRRGTGKTHVIKVLESELRKDNRNTVCYIDCRTLGSTSQFSDSSIPIQRRCLSLFRDILLSIYHVLLEHIVEEPSAMGNEALTEADNLANIITEPLSIFKTKKIKTEDQLSHSVESDLSAKARLAIPGIGGDIKSTRKDKSSSLDKKEIQYVVETHDKVIFPELQRSLKSVLELADTRLFVLIDEWSSLPLDIQPYLSEFLKRGLLPISAATLKIGALEYRCRFSITHDGSLFGFELGADIATAPDLDDYFVFDRNPDQVTDIYADVLLKHISSELPEGYFREQYGISTPRQFSSRLFTERNTSIELARASEGVIRDLINIYTQAFFHAQRRNRDSIDKKAILESSRQWFEQDKAQYLDDQLQEILRRIVDEVIGKRRARSFLLPRHLERHPIIQRLFDARVLHHMQRGYADKDNPGIRYNIYAIDYGAYVDLIGTSKEPELELQIRSEQSDIIVPFDDKRSIRRIVLDAAILE
jgi:hypothetical protein